MEHQLLRNCLIGLAWGWPGHKVGEAAGVHRVSGVLEYGLRAQPAQEK